jgi:integrase
MMPRRVRDANLESRTARERIKPGKLRYRAVEPGLHLGYRRLKAGAAGTWIARRYMGHGNYVVEALGPADDSSEADGERVLSFWQAQDLARQLHKQRSQTKVARLGSYKVRDAVADYVAYLQAEKKTARDVSYRMRAHVLPTFGDKPVAKLTTDEIKIWHRALAERPPRLRTKAGKEQKHRTLDLKDEDAKRKRQLSANRCLAQLKAALNKAIQDERVACEDVWRTVGPFKNTDVARVAYLQVDKARRLVNACDGDFKLLVQAALLTGARYGELCGLNVADFNPDTGTLHVRTSKSGRGRHIVLTVEGRSFFDLVTAGRPSAEPMLRNSSRSMRRTEGSDNGRWRKSEQLRPMREACKRARIDPPVGLHQLRHTWASLSTMGGMPLPVVARNLGHVDTRMVEKHYGHMSEDFVAQAIRDHAPTFGILDVSSVKRIRRR